MTGVMHGGRLDDAIARFGGRREKWIDLSTGINPHAYAVPEIAPGAWSQLPDQRAYDDAVEAVRNAYAVDNDAGVSLAPGSQMHIQVLPFLYKPQAVAIVGFTYQEHGICWGRAGHDVYVTDGLESAEATARIVVIVNPNNPDGRLFDPGDLIGLARRLGAKGGLLIVDESFADVAPMGSVANQVGRDGLLVMRSLGKFFGLAGARFGAVLTTQVLATRLNERLGPWAVSGPALGVATAALNDLGWRKRMLKRLAREREELEELLMVNDLGVVGGTSLFVLAQTPRAAQFWEHLAQAHILVRSFPGKPQWLRFGIPGGKVAQKRLAKTLNGFAEIG